LQHILSELRERGAYVAHNVDATDLLLQRPAIAVSTDDSSSDVSGDGSVTTSYSDSGSSSGDAATVQADVQSVNTAAAAVIASTPVDAIVFQFPHTHGGKMKINRQRALVREFFHSARSLLQHYNSLDVQQQQQQQQQQQHDSTATSGHIISDTQSSSGTNDVLTGEQHPAADEVQQTGPRTEPRQIIVTLAKGQGGTAADGEFRRKIGNSWQVHQTELFNLNYAVSLSRSTQRTCAYNSVLLW
jgi:Domain of unknown function (DUF2431)